MKLRLATNLDRDTIRRVHLAAFSEDEREMVSSLAVTLLAENTAPETFSLAAESEGVLVGHVAFSPVMIDCAEKIQGYILAPLGVAPDYQKCGAGSKLVNNGIQRLRKMGVNILLVYGDPNYYGQFGFSVDAAEQYVPPYKLEYPEGWQALVLNKFTQVKSPVKITCVASLSDPLLW